MVEISLRECVKISSSSVVAKVIVDVAVKVAAGLITIAVGKKDFATQNVKAINFHNYEKIVAIITTTIRIFYITLCTCF